MTRLLLHSICSSILLLFILAGCKKEDPVDVDPNPGICLNCNLSCYLDTAIWNATITKCYISPHDPPDIYEQFSFYITEQNPVDGYADILSITSIPAFPGHYIIYPPTPLIHGLTCELVIKKEPKGIGNRDLSYSDADSLESYIDVEYVNFETNTWKASFHLEMDPFLNWLDTSATATYPEYFSVDGIAQGEFKE